MNKHIFAVADSAAANGVSRNPESDKKPRIGLMTNSVRGPHSKRWWTVLETRNAEIVVIKPGAPRHELPGLLRTLDGVFVTGGNPDLNELFHDAGQHYHHRQTFDLRRTRTSLPLIRLCRQYNIPTLLICLGLQELNVAFGGTLKYLPSSKIAGHLSQTALDQSFYDRFREKHAADFDRESVLREIFGTTSMRVNSYHRWAIDKPAHGLRILATSPKDGVIEAVGVAEPDDLEFFIALQWHGEIDSQGVHAPLWDRFFDAAHARQERRLNDVPNPPTRIIRPPGRILRKLAR